MIEESEEISFFDCTVGCSTISPYRIIYADGVPPDGTPERVIHAVILAIAVIVDILAFTGILFAVMCLVFDIKFRNRK